MIFGRFDISGNAVHTHNDTYILSNISTISARRPFLISGLMIAGLVSTFGVSFSDLLRPTEVAVIASGAASCVLLGIWLGQLQLLSRDLRGSELSTAIWGSYRHLNRIRREVADAVNRANAGGGS